MKKRHTEEHENLERWLVSYADFITLLFAFFTVLYALSQADKTKYKNTVENIQRAFLSAGGIFPLKGSPLTPFEKPADKGSMLPPTILEPGRYNKTPRQEDVDRMAEHIRGVFERTTGLSNSPGEIDVIRDNEGFKIRLAEHILFKPGSIKLQRQHVPFLYEIGRQLARLNFEIQIEAHTDNSEPMNGKTNWEVSLARSYNILKFMVEGVKYPKNKISLTAYGDIHPIADNTTPEGRTKNRRVEIAVILPDREVPELPW